jgi:CRP-like cAMP-binding protein
MIEELAELLTHHPVFSGLDPDAIDLIAGCAHNVAFDSDEALLSEGGDATTFYLIRRGLVALEIHRPGLGALVIETIGPGGAVGWSWLFPPYRWHFDARALEPVGAVAIDGACLRTKAETDPALGYALMKRFGVVMLERLQATRIRLLDVYGSVDAH